MELPESQITLIKADWQSLDFKDLGMSYELGTQTLLNTREKQKLYPYYLLLNLKIYEDS